MSKQAVSVTLERDNILWLRARMRALRRRSLSDTLDQLVAEARAQLGRSGDARRSVVGTITIADSDPDLTGADDAIRALFSASVARRKPGPSRRGRKGGVRVRPGRRDA